MEMSSKLPQLAKTGEPGEGWVMEPKYDGHRMLAFVSGDSVRMYARTGVEKTGKLPAIERELARWADGVYDGEVVDLRRVGGEWSSVQSVLGSEKARAGADALTFVAFDVLESVGTDVRGFTLTERGALLEASQPYDPEPHVVITPQVPYDPDEVEGLIAEGWEGVIAKDPCARYASGKRGHGWVKIKATNTVDVIITGFTPGKGAFADTFGAIRFAQIRDDSLVERGQCSGLSMELRQEMAVAPEKFIGRVMEIAHWGVMESGSFRFPQFKRMRDDKDALSVTWHNC